MQMKHNFPKFMGCSKSTSKREFKLYKLSQEIGIVPNRQYNFILKITRKRTTK